MQKWIKYIPGDVLPGAIGNFVDIVTTGNATKNYHCDVDSVDWDHVAEYCVSQWVDPLITPPPQSSSTCVDVIYTYRSIPLFGLSAGAVTWDQVEFFKFSDTQLPDVGPLKKLRNKNRPVVAGEVSSIEQAVETLRYSEDSPVDQVTLPAHKSDIDIQVEFIKQLSQAEERLMEEEPVPVKSAVTWIEGVAPPKPTLRDVIDNATIIKAVKEVDQFMKNLDATEPLNNNFSPKSSTDPKSRYYDAGGIETIGVIIAKLTPEQLKGYLLGNVIKYSCRLNFKGDCVRDAEKIKFYSNWLEELKGD